ncbi:hypothetical protein FY034_18865 (plasmid) [Trichlorobacter lovleyi]|uniref:hypothetical protein n=1 Tax=Trichlorobacter lovleyi TaxID=313985 RepID=UPI0022403814|nr:hypothetical protein [Trichlorobacter lovleyi]QOX81040.1 hypothetical protein FY034_18865 [Trichlorobacter lovleyi]
MNNDYPATIYPPANQRSYNNGARYDYKPQPGDMVRVLAVLKDDLYACDERIKQGWVIQIENSPAVQTATSARADFYRFTFAIPENESTGNIAKFFCVEPV